MPAPLSIVIPTLNAANALPACAAALLPAVTERLVGSLVVSDGGSTDATLDVAQDLGAVVVKGAAGRGGQIARGVEATVGDWVLILHADTLLSRGWVTEASEFIVKAPNRAGYFRLRFRSDGWVPWAVAQGANLRSRVFGLPYGDQGLLVSKRLLAEVGGVPDVPLMEDVILARRLRGRLVALNAEAHTSAERYERDGWARRIARNLWTLAKWRAGVSPERLVAGYERGR